MFLNMRESVAPGAGTGNRVLRVYGVAATAADGESEEPPGCPSVTWTTSPRLIRRPAGGLCAITVPGPAEAVGCAGITGLAGLPNPVALAGPSPASGAGCGVATASRTPIVAARPEAVPNESPTSDGMT